MPSWPLRHYAIAKLIRIIRKLKCDRHVPTPPLKCSDQQCI
ncbi:MAG TPA: hypothetical protein V6D14_10985 [Coleofasciculaceae cyanobacterium]